MAGAMILMFGASSDVGRRTARRLLDSGHRLRLVARDPSALDHRAEWVAGDMSCAKTAAADADVVVSCAHARFTGALIEAIDGRTPRLVLMGSAWRYSPVAEERGEAVRAGEEVFLASARDGVMLHPTLIYGGEQENNIGRLLDALGRTPILPVPGGGNNLVQPVYIDDVVDCVAAAVAREWNGPHIIPVCGPQPITWRDMAAMCAQALGRRTYLLPVPLGPMISVLRLARNLGIPVPLDPNVLLRFREDVVFPTAAMLSTLGVSPRDFATGIRQFVLDRSTV